MFSKMFKYFTNIKVVVSSLISIMALSFVSLNAYTDYKLEQYITVTALDSYMIKRDVQALLRKIEYLKLDLQNADTASRQVINDKISLIDTQIRQIRGE